MLLAAIGDSCYPVVELAACHEDGARLRRDCGLHSGTRMPLAEQPMAIGQEEGLSDDAVFGR